MYSQLLREAVGYARFLPFQFQKHRRSLRFPTKTLFQNQNTNRNLLQEISQQELRPRVSLFTFEKEKPTVNYVAEVGQEEGEPLHKQISSCQYPANLQIEDKVFMGSLNSIQAQAFSVFDGHGGAMLSDYCAVHINDLIDSFIEKNKTKQLYTESEDQLITDALKWAYQQLQTNFYQDIYTELAHLKSKKVRNIGSCGLTLVLYKQKIYVANCGDSMALAVTQKDHHIGYIALNERLSVNNPNQRERLRKQFPLDEDILSQESNGSYYLKGRLQPTRTLGDYHMKHQKLWKGKGEFHGPYVSSEPEISIHRLTEEVKYVIVASDGVWDFATEAQVSRACVNGDPATQILEETLKKIGQINGRTVEEIGAIQEGFRRRFHDDISIIAVTLK